MVFLKGCRQNLQKRRKESLIRSLENNVRTREKQIITKLLKIANFTATKTKDGKIVKNDINCYMLLVKLSYQRFY
jgi:hypothetical protein